MANFRCLTCKRDVLDVKGLPQCCGEQMALVPDSREVLGGGPNPMIRTYRIAFSYIRFTEDFHSQGMIIMPAYSAEDALTQFKVAANDGDELNPLLKEHRGHDYQVFNLTPA